MLNFKLKFTLFLLVLSSFLTSVYAKNKTSLHQEIIHLGNELEEKIIHWRRDIHANPELSNREFRTAKIVVEHLKALGMEVKTDIAHTGVVGLLKGKKARPLIGLRADMDALPVTEQVDLPFASKAKAIYRGQEVGVMHACGHDTHVAILMGVAEALTKIKDQLPGSVLFVFQPAEEGAPEGEEGGAELMLKEGLFKQNKPDAMFGLHVTSSMPSGLISFRKGPAMAAVDDFKITITGRQTHGSRPWSGIDPIVTSAQIIMAVQTIVSRQVDVTKAPAVVSFGAINGGVRNNIIPDSVEMVGTIRNFDMGIRDHIHDRLKTITRQVAESAGASAEIIINEGYPVTVNDEVLGAKLYSSLEKAVGKDQVITPSLITGAEDFSFFAQEVPGFYFFLGVTPKDRDYKTAPSNHSPLFYVDESALLKGFIALNYLTLDYMELATINNN